MISTSRSKVKRVQASPRQIEEQLLYHKGSDGAYDITITDYWDKVVCRILPAYASYKFSQGARRVICPFHDDVAPSLGIVIDRETGVEVFNCFGCGAHGTVTQFHAMFYRKYKGLTSKSNLEAFHSLASIYGVSLSHEVSKVMSTKPDVDFNRQPSYTVKMHLNNVLKIRSMYDSGQISLNEMASQLDKLIERSLKAKSSETERG